MFILLIAIFVICSMIYSRINDSISLKNSNQEYSVGHVSGVSRLVRYPGRFMEHLNDPESQSLRRFITRLGDEHGYGVDAVIKVINQERRARR